MSEFIPLAQIDEVVEAVRKRIHHQPKIALILGSGLGGLADAVVQPDIIPYEEIPHWYRSTVEGHAGRLVIGNLEGKPLLVMQGRSHYYEGISMAQVGLPIRVMQRLGIEILIVTNAAGAINPDYAPGELMLINDHIALMAMAGLNPLRGPNIPEFGPRFPDMSQAYDRDLLKIARRVADEQKVGYREGVYICLAGPSFESPADLRFLRVIGADAVGMSTVPEVIAARHGGMRVLGISGISNKANLDGNTITTHAEVLEAGKMLVPRLTAVINGVLRALP
ncbi:MAG: purine-nucleoside phosphorylase [Anaerolineaceae bacterium]|nr:purine-nucleoside phosphorylase [Anaerolineaceae bacterium]